MVSYHGRILPLIALLAAWPIPTRAAGPLLDRHGDPLPAGAIARLGSIRFLHSAAVRSLAFSTDGKTLISDSHESFFRAWDVSTGREVRRFSLEKDATVARLAVSPDGRLAAATVSNRSVLTVWDTVSGKQFYSRQFDDSSYYAPLAWTSDGKILAVAIGTNIALLDPTTGKMLRQFDKAPQQQLEQLVFSPDGKRLLSSASSGPACVWDVAAGKLLHKLGADSDTVGHLTFSRDGKSVAGACEYPLKEPPGAMRAAFRLWDVATGKKIRDLPAWDVHCAAFSPDGKIAAAGAFRDIALIDPGSGKLVRQWRAHDVVTALAFSPDGKVLATGGQDQRIRLWDVGSGKELWPTEGHRQPVGSVAFAADGRTVVSATTFGTIRFWDWISGRQRAYKVEWGLIRMVCSPNGKRLATREGDVIRIWDATTGKVLFRQKRQAIDQFQALAFLPDSENLAVSFADGRIGVWQPSTGKLLRQVGPRFKERITSLCASPDGRYLAWAWADREDHFGIRDLATGEDRHRFTEKYLSRGNPLAFSPDGSILAAASGCEPISAPIGFWNVATGKKLYEWEREYLEGVYHVKRVAFSPDGIAVAAVRSLRRDVRLADRHTGKVIRPLLGHQGNVNAVAFSPDSRALVTASDDGTLLVWDLSGRWRDGRWPAIALKPKELEEQWSALGDADAAKRWRAIWMLSDCPQAAAFLAGKLQPVRAERIQQLIAELDDDGFAVREKASHQLAAGLEIAEPALRKALTSHPTLEARRRIEALLQSADKLDAQPPPPEQLRLLNAIAVLEHLGDTEARKVLQRLADGAPTARLTREAKAALVNLSNRALAHP